MHTTSDATACRFKSVLQSSSTFLIPIFLCPFRKAWEGRHYALPVSAPLSSIIWFPMANHFEILTKYAYQI